MANNGHEFKYTNNPRAERQSAEAINAVHIRWNSEIQRHQVINKVHPYFTGAINATVTQGIAAITHIKNNYRVQTQILGGLYIFSIELDFYAFTPGPGGRQLPARTELCHCTGAVLNVPTELLQPSLMEQLRQLWF